MGYYKDDKWQPNANEIASGEYMLYEAYDTIVFRLNEHRNKVLEEAAKLCEEGNLASNYACAEAIRGIKR